ncbi:DNA polymerase III subunit alpha [Agreia pratensis]|uniref:DNA polymerase III subunit alpha n=1 Tax=Agreia pratensis TaxID=150121 RepID=UPI00188B849A|nr:DNA polymerase III subunit alpha [Agreia pratensis]MBF4634670.1 DNA polymerase III subunit alpha [Agreia pratensis]
MTFTHLHVASSFSVHHGTRGPAELVGRAAEAGARSAAITDRDGLYGAVRHIRQCIESAVNPIVGVELQLDDATPDARPSSVTVLAHGHNDGAGWAGLSRLISAAHSPKRGRRILSGTANRAAAIPATRLPSFIFSDGHPVATVMLGADSDVGRAVAAHDKSAAWSKLQAWKRLLAGAVVVEVVCHFTTPGQPRSVEHAAAMLELADAALVPAVLTNEVRYAVPDDALTGDVLDAAGRLQPLGAFTPQPNGQAWLKPESKMRAIATEIIEYSTLDTHAGRDLLTATETLAEQCALDPESDVAWQKPKVPELTALGITGDPADFLWKKCLAAIPERYPHARDTALEVVHGRLADEMKNIIAFGFSSYFLTVSDVSEMMRRMRIRNQARGSGAGSLVVYLLRISNVDPLEHDLLFERFLGNKRSTLPDIDIDVESARRHDVYRAIFDRYGDHRVTLLSMQNTYRARGAARDAGLALGLDEQQIDFVANNIWRFEARDFRAVLDEKPELQEIAALVRNDSRMNLLVDVVGRLDRLPRHISQHPCGVILGDSNLLSYTPTQPSGIGLAMSQFDKDDIDDVGFLKLDVLGVRMQSTLAYAVREIERVNGPDAAAAGQLPIDAPYVSPGGIVELDAIPHDDEPTFEAIRTAHTLGMFQIESPGQRELIGKMQPDCYEDLIADISLFRPGPMKGNMVAPFIDTKHGFQDPDYLHPSFKPFLKETYGVVLYHEHILRIFHACMGISLAEADELRRAMEKQAEGIEEYFRQKTRANVDQRGRRRFTDADGNRIWKVLAGFASYGFCKAHGAAFALPTYQSAWLKTHYPVEFLAGIFEHDPGMYERRLLMAEARRMGVSILPLDVNASTDEYLVERTPDGTKGIRYSLTDVHGITQPEKDRILAGQPYDSIVDFYTRATPSRRLLVSLATVGALDSLSGGASRGDAIAYARQLTARRKPKAGEHENQLELYAVDDVPAGHAEPTAQERIGAELDILSTELNEHLIESYRPLLDSLGVTPAANLVSLPNRTEVIVAGVRVATQTPPMRSGKRVVFISLDDGTGCSDATFFDEAQKRSAQLLFGTRLLLIRGRTRRTGARGVSLQAEEAFDLKQAWAMFTSVGE